MLQLTSIEIEKSLLFLSVVISSAIAFALLNEYRKHLKDTTKLKLTLRSFVRNQPLVAGLDLRTSTARDLWHSVQALVAQRRKSEQQQFTFYQVIALGKKIAAAVDNPQNTAIEVVNLISSQLGSDIKAVALYTRHPSTCSVKLEHLVGLPLERVSEALLMNFEKRFNSTEQQPQSGHSQWGYSLPSKNGFHNFSAYQFGLELNVPLLEAEQIIGGIWIAFSNSSSSLNIERQEFIQAVAQHAASSITAAYRALSRIEETTREKDFLLGLSHDLRAPGNIALFALRDLLNDQQLPISLKQRTKLSMVEQSLEEQLALLGDVLNYAKHRRGLLEPSRRAVNISESLKQIVCSYAEVATQRGLTFNASELPEIQVLVDQSHLQRIVSNFLSNAIKFTDAGSIAISFHTDRDHLEIVVKDSGCGVPAHQQHAVFKEFCQGDSQIPKDGVGLGLALAKVLSELNDGYTFYVPNKPVGSIFGVGIPIHRPVRASQSQLETQPNSRAQTILIIDDDPATCRTISRYLSNFSLKVDIAHNSVDAYALINATKPDLIVSDLWLNNESIENLLQQLNYDGAEIPTLILTGSCKPRLNFNDCKFPIEILEKPSSREQVVNAAQKLLLQKTSYSTPLTTNNCAIA